MKVTVFDTESDGFLKEATKIHIMSWTTDGIDYHSTSSYDKMKEVLNNCDLAVCHNVICHDMPLLKKIAGYDSKFTKYADSMALSRTLFPDRKINKSLPAPLRKKPHSIEAWAHTFGMHKPEVDDWVNISWEKAKERCEEDVKINYKLWLRIVSRMRNLYDNPDDRLRYIKYLSFKMDCMREQEDIGVKINVPAAKKLLEDLERSREESHNMLRSVMPMVTKYKTKSPPKNMKKKDGTLSAHGEKWRELCKEHGYSDSYLGDIEVVDHVEEPNPGSSEQIKDWLTELGWKPATFKFVKDKTTGAERKIPQIRKQKELCPSVERLAEEVEEVKYLTGLSVVQHRIGVVKGFLDAVEDGWVEAKTSGFTNTLRFTHASPCVNLPGVDKPWGKEIRGLLLAPTPAHYLCGADMSSLEATTKAHYIHPYDPAYAEALTDEFFDEHLDLAVQNNEVTKEEYTYYVYNDLEGDERWDKLHSVRKAYKPVNYSGIYGVGKAKLAREAGFTEKVAEDLLKKYWERNWAVKELVKPLEVKEVGGISWLKNPVSGFWYELRHEKDRFSTLNQSTGVFLFDAWVARVRRYGIQVCAQFHDEILFWTVKKKQAGKILDEAIREVNEDVDLNVTLRIDYKFGKNYAEVH